MTPSIRITEVIFEKSHDGLHLKTARPVRSKNYRWICLILLLCIRLGSGEEGMERTTTETPPLPAEALNDQDKADSSSQDEETIRPQHLYEPKEIEWTPRNCDFNFEEKNQMQMENDTTCHSSEEPLSSFVEKDDVSVVQDGHNETYDAQKAMSQSTLPINGKGSESMDNPGLVSSQNSTAVLSEDQKEVQNITLEANPLIRQAMKRVEEEDSRKQNIKKEKMDKPPKQRFFSNKKVVTKKPKPPKSKGSDMLDGAEDEAVKAGARLLSRGLNVVSKGLHIASGGVRVGGDTTAGLLGSSVKILGTAVKSVGSGLQATSKLMEVDHTKVSSSAYPSTSTRRSKGGELSSITSLTDGISSTVPKKPSARTSWRKTKPDGTPRLSVARRSRQIAAKGVKTLGGVIGGLGETLVSTGSATERLTSTGAGLAADVVKLMEDFTGSLSIGLVQKREGSSRIKLRRIPDFLKQQASSRVKYDRSDPRTVAGRREASPFWLYGSHETTPGNDNRRQTKAPFFSEFFLAIDDLWTNPSPEAVENLSEIIISSATGLGTSLLEDTEEVPSLSIEIGIVLGICFVTSLFLLGSSRSSRYTPETKPIPQVVEVSPQNGNTSSRAKHTVASTTDRDCSLKSDERQPRRQSFGLIDAMAMLGRFVTRIFSGLWYTGWQLVRFLVCSVIAFISLFFHRVALLFYVYFACWLFLSHASMVRTKTVQRNTEANGFRSLIALLGTEEMSSPETAFWMNAIIDHVWRVPFGDEKTPVLQAMQELGYPMYVSRAAQEEMKKRGCNSTKGPNSDSVESPLCMPYGGLEPYISSTIGAMLVTELDANKDYYIPSDVAYVTLHSFTLGRRPPIVRSVELVKAILGQENRREGDRVEIDVDVDVLLTDLSFVLGKCGTHDECLTSDKVCRCIAYPSMFDYFLFCLDAKLTSLQYAKLPSTKLEIHAADMKLSVSLALTFSPEYPYVESIEFSLRETPVTRISITPFQDDRYVSVVGKRVFR